MWQKMEKGKYITLVQFVVGFLIIRPHKYTGGGNRAVKYDKSVSLEGNFIQHKKSFSCVSGVIFNEGEQKILF